MAESSCIIPDMNSASRVSRSGGSLVNRVPGNAKISRDPASENGDSIVKMKNALRVGLCGIGRAGLGMVRRDFQKLPQIKVVAGFDLLEERTRQLAEICSSRIYASYARMLKDQDVELVIVATRSHEHVRMALQALKAGKDVLVEKPMALNLAGAEKLISAARKLGRRLFVRQNRRFDVPFLQAMEIVRSGKIGKLFAVQLRHGAYQRRSDWQTIRKYGGGQLLNWGPHLIDWAHQFIGGKATDVWSDLKRIAAAGDAEDHVKLLMRGENGVVVDIEISGAAAIPQSPWRLYGTTGSLVIDAKNQCHLKYFDPSRLSRIKAREDTPAARSGAHVFGGEEIKWIEEKFPAAPAAPKNFWVELHRSVRTGTQFPITLEQARENMRVITLAKKGTGF
jgi:scyllo-inositol 2-dehydrogenase (NADP+)